MSTAKVWDGTSWLALANDENGTDLAPTYSFAASPSTGMYLVPLGANLHFATSGSSRMSMNSSGISTFVPILTIDGTALAPTYSFASNPDTGMYRIGTDAIGFATAGADLFRMNSSALRGNVNYTFLMPGKTAGSEAEPAYSFVADTDTGMYRQGTNEIGFSTAGTENLRLTGSNLRMASATSVIYNTGYFRGVATTGDASNPTFSWDGNTNSGMYTDGSNVFFGVGASRKGAFSNDRLYLYGATGNSDYIGPINSSYFYNVTASSYFYFSKEIRVTNALTSHSGTLELQDRDTRVIQLEGAAGANGNAIVYQSAHSGTLWLNAGQQSALRILPMASDPEAAGGIAGILWQTTYSTDRHVHARVFHASGDTMTWRNYENTAYTGHDALDYTVVSSEKGKARIRTARDERGVLDFAVPGPKKMAFGQVRKVRPVLFDNLEQERLWEWAGCPGYDKKTGGGADEDGEPTYDVEHVVHATRDECNECCCSGQDNMVKKQHHCDDYICGGTKEVPCGLIEMHVDRVGLIAEELNEVFPKAVKKDAYGDPIGIRYDVVTVELLNIVQHLLEDRDECRTREARETMARRRNDAAIADLAAQVQALTDLVGAP